MGAKGLIEKDFLFLLKDRDWIHICLVKRIIFSFENNQKRNQLEHENVTELVLVTLRDGVEEGRGFSNEGRDPMTSKELNEEPYEVKISCTVL